MTVRATAGGTFNPADRFVYFAAGSASAYPLHLLIAVNDCFTAGGEAELERLLDEGHSVLLDSGVFWLTNQHMRATHCTMDEALQLPPERISGFSDLFNRYLHLTKKFGDRLWGYIELDQGGRDNKRRMRDRLHAEGLSPMPVYHPLNDGWDYFDELATGYDRICFGNIVQAGGPARVRLLHTLWERRRQYPDLWVHVLGLTANEWCLPFPPDSCDSSSWLNGLRFPNVRTEVSVLRRLGDLGNRFRYEQGPDKQQQRASIDLACQAYADAVTRTNQVWRDALASPDRPTHPPRMPAEGELKPCI